MEPEPDNNFSIEKDQTLLRIENLKGNHFGPVSLRLQAREQIWLSGPSGSGKSLFLRAVADLDPNSGEVWLGNSIRTDLSPEYWRAQVALLPAESHWWAETVGEHFPTSSTQSPEALGFDSGVFKWKVSRLSSGERQRLALLRLLANHPQILLLDEPTANLDRENVLRVEGLIGNYIEQTQSCAIWVSHDRDQAERIADRTVLFANGQLATA